MVIFEEVLKQHQDALLANPNEINNSIGFIVKHLKQKHIDAANFMHDKFGITLSTHTLHNIILNFDTAKAHSKVDIVISTATEGTFYPSSHLVAYFQSQSWKTQ